MKNTGAFGELKLTSADVSVVVQGAVSEQTARTLTSVRQHLPDAEIVLSTWEGADTSGLNYDKLVISADPGQDGLIRRFPFPHANNVNRQIISTREGIKASTRDYCLKLRSDMEVRSDGFLQIFRHFHQPDEANALFRKRIMVEGLTTSLTFPFAVGDWWNFGRREDLYGLFDIPPYVSGILNELEYYEQTQHARFRPFLSDVICRHPPEPYIVAAFLAKHRQFKYTGFYQGDEKIMALSQAFIRSNLIAAEPELTGIELPKAANIQSPASFHNALAFDNWFEATRSMWAVNSQAMSYADNLKSNSSFRKHKEKYRKDIEIENRSAELSVLQNYTRNSGLVSIEDDDLPISEQELTFVVAGRVENTSDNSAERCLASIRKNFPVAKIVLSTWAGTDVSSLEGLYDEVVFSDTLRDPPQIYVEGAVLQKVNSISLQQVLMAAGLAIVRTSHAVRFRTDFEVTNNNMLEFYNYWKFLLNKFRSDYRLFDSRMLLLRVVTINPRFTGGHYVHQPSDLFQLGRVDDLRDLWTGEHMPPELSTYFADNPMTLYNNVGMFNHRFTAEQFPWLRLVERTLPNIWRPGYYYESDPDRMTFETEALFASNFIIASQAQLGLQSKFDEATEFKGDVFYKFHDFLDAYVRTVDPHDPKVLQHYWLAFYKSLALERRFAHRFGVWFSALRGLRRLEAETDVSALSRRQMPDAHFDEYATILRHSTPKVMWLLAPTYGRTWMKLLILRGLRLVKRFVPKIVRLKLRSLLSRLINLMAIIRDNAV